MAYDLDAVDVLSGVQAIGVFFDGGLGIRTDGGLVKIEVCHAHLADGRIDTMLIFADFAFGAVLVDKAFGLGHATVIFAQIIFWAILGYGFWVALRAATSIAAFLPGGAIDPDLGIAITVDALACTAVANVAFVPFA